MTVFKTSRIYVGNTRLKMLISVPESMIERQREAFPGGPVVQWLRIRLPVRGTRVRSLFWEDPTCLRAAKPMCRNYVAGALEPMSRTD